MDDLLLAEYPNEYPNEYPESGSEAVARERARNASDGCLPSVMLVVRSKHESLREPLMPAHTVEVTGPNPVRPTKGRLSAGFVISVSNSRCPGPREEALLALDLHRLTWRAASSSKANDALGV